MYLFRWCGLSLAKKTLMMLDHIPKEPSTLQCLTLKKSWNSEVEEHIMVKEDEESTFTRKSLGLQPNMHGPLNVS